MDKYRIFEDILLWIPLQKTAQCIGTTGVSCIGQYQYLCTIRSWPSVYHTLALMSAPLWQRVTWDDVHHQTASPDSVSPSSSSPCFYHSVWTFVYVVISRSVVNQRWCRARRKWHVFDRKPPQGWTGQPSLTSLCCLSNSMHAHTHAQTHTHTHTHTHTRARAQKWKDRPPLLVTLRHIHTLVNKKVYLNVLSVELFIVWVSPSSSLVFRVSLGTTRAAGRTRGPRLRAHSLLSLISFFVRPWQPLTKGLNGLFLGVLFWLIDGRECARNYTALILKNRKSSP